MVFPGNRQILNSLVTKQENKNSICLLYKSFRNGYRPHMIVKFHKVILKIRKKWKDSQNIHFFRLHGGSLPNVNQMVNVVSNNSGQDINTGIFLFTFIYIYIYIYLSI